MMDVEWAKIIIEIVGMAFAALGIYVAIRIDMAVMHEKFRNNDVRVNEIKSDVDYAHQRIDGFFEIKERRHREPH